MYVSRAVAAMRDDPVPGESVELVLRIEESADVTEVADAVRGLGGEPSERLPFGDLRATVPQESVGRVCELSGLTAVETDNIYTVDLDGACEDVEY